MAGPGFAIGDSGWVNAKAGICDRELVKAQAGAVRIRESELAKAKANAGGGEMMKRATLGRADQWVAARPNPQSPTSNPGFQ